MSSNYIIIFLALMLPVSAFLCFKIGYQTGKAVSKGAEVPSVLPFRTEKDVLTAEQKRLNNILANIDNYDGTGEGQVKL